MKENFQILIKTSEEYDKVFNRLVLLGYVWECDGSTRHTKFSLTYPDFLIQDGRIFRTGLKPYEHNEANCICQVFTVKQFLDRTNNGLEIE